MAINELYHERYRGDFTATGASITGYFQYSYLKSPDITDAAVYQATRGRIDIPSTATVEKAFLVWACDVYYEDTVTSSLYLRTPASATDKLVDASYITTDQFEVSSSSHGFNYYGFSYDVTNLVKAGGTGDYWVYNFDVTPKPNIPGKAGWSLYVFYKDDTASYKDLSFNAGMLGVGALFTTPVTITIDGILTPTSGNVYGRIGATELNTTAGEPDSFYVNTSKMSDDFTPENDFANSISTINNTLMDTWPPQSVPATTDTEEFQTKVIALKGYEVPNGAESIDVSIDVPRFAPTSNDQIVAIVTAFDLYDADFRIEKNVDNDLPYVNDTITYTIDITNKSDYSSGHELVFKDVLPSKLTYVPNSMRIVSDNFGGYIGTLTDPADTDNGKAIGNTVTINLGIGATSDTGGVMVPNDTVRLQFKAIVNSNANVGDLITNIATISGKSEETEESFTFKGKNTIEVDASPFPVKRASKYSFRTHITSDIDFKVTYNTSNIRNNSSVITIEDEIDSILQIRNYYIDLTPSSGISIVNQTVGNKIKYVITANGTSVFPEGFSLYIETTYLKDTVEGECYTIINTSFMQINSEEPLPSNTVYIQSITKREQARIDLIESVALEQTALSHIINAEGEKIQRIMEISDSKDDILRINASVEKTINSIYGLESILMAKLKYAKKEGGCKIEQP